MHLCEWLVISLYFLYLSSCKFPFTFPFSPFPWGKQLIKRAHFPTTLHHLLSLYSHYLHSLTQFFSCIRRQKQMYCAILILQYSHVYIVYLLLVYCSIIYFLVAFACLQLWCSSNPGSLLLFLWRNIISFSACSIPLSLPLQVSGQLNFNYGHVIVLFILVTMTVIVAINCVHRITNTHIHTCLLEYKIHACVKCTYIPYLYTHITCITILTSLSSRQDHTASRPFPLFSFVLWCSCLLFLLQIRPA